VPGHDWGQADRTFDIRYAEYVTSFKQYQYTQMWIDRLTEACTEGEGFEEATGREPVRIEHGATTSE
jgi:hypothetical protein